MVVVGDGGGGLVVLVTKEVDWSKRQNRREIIRSGGGETEFGGWCTKLSFWRAALWS